MSGFAAVAGAHPGGEAKSCRPVGPQPPTPPIVVDTQGRRFHVEWDPHAPVTALGQLVFFSQFLATAGLFSEWVRTCPLQFRSPNAPSITDLLGTITLSILSGQFRYSHVTALRADTVNPQGFGMTKVCSEDSVRRAFANADAQACARWQREALRNSWLPALQRPWVLDMDTTIKPIYGHQQGAEVGYNPHKPGRPSHSYHTLMVRNLRLVLDVEVRSGKQHASKHGAENLWRLWEELPAQCRPALVCGDAGFGNEALMAGCEARGQKYLFRLRQSLRVKQLVNFLMVRTGWKKALHNWEGMEGALQLDGWTSKRRVVVFRRQSRQRAEVDPDRSLDQPCLKLGKLTAQDCWEYQVLVTNLEDEVLGLCDLYRQRADIENAYDELKNQWGWGGFVTRDLKRCQIAARNVALVYNWWSLFVACAQPERGREAITSRPLLLAAVGRVTASGRQLTLRLTSTHAGAAEAQSLLTGLSLFLSSLGNAAEQLGHSQRWRRIWDRILAPRTRPQRLIPAASG